MADGTVGVRQAPDADRLIDNEVVVNEEGQTVHRQRVAIGSLGGAATEASLGAVVTQLGALLEATYDNTAATNWVYGSVTAAPGQTQVIVGHVTTADTVIRAISLTADGDGYVTVTVDDVTVFSTRLDALNKSRLLTVPLRLTTGQTVEVRVVGEAMATSTYEGTIFLG